MRSSWSSKIVLVLVLIWVALGCAWLVQMVSRSIGHSSVTACASNLKSLWTSQFNYAAQYDKPDGDMPDETGSAFFLRLQRTPKPLIDRHEPFFCPLTDETPGPGRCSYRGPALPIKEMMKQHLDPLSADKEGNHGPGAGGNVLTKMGDIKEVGETDPLWLRARVTTKD
jgi:hypothetical protein